jgi:hypothetical protein
VENFYIFHSDNNSINIEYEVSIKLRFMFD